MATLQITQIPTETETYTGSNTYDELIPVNYWQIAPVTVNITDNISAYFNIKYILRVYKDSVSADNLLGTLKQRTNNSSTTADQVAIFDIRGIVNTQLKPTYKDSETAGSDIHGIGRNTATKIFSKNNETVATIVVKATWERSTASNSAPEEQTGGTDEVTMTMYFAPATFDLFAVSTNTDTNPLADYTTANNTKQLLSNAPNILDYRKLNQQVGGGDFLSGYMNYVAEQTDFHTIAFQNKSGWGSDGGFLGVQFYESDGTLMNTYTFPNDTTRGGEPPASANSDDEYLLFAGCGTGNLEGYTGKAHKDNSALADFDGQPSGATVRGWAYYRVYMCDNQNGTSSIRSRYYYFVKDFTGDYNCKGHEILRLAWLNTLGGWDYFDFRGGFTETVNIERVNYTSVLGAEQLETGSVYSFDTWGAGTQSLVTSSVLKATIQTQYITQEEGAFLENMFNSTSVMALKKGTQTTSQRVVVTNKSFQRKTSPKNKLQIQYTFEIEYSNPLNTNS
jgi:hypothetical protein